MPSDLCKQLAAQAWFTPATRHLPKEPALEAAFAQILTDVLSQPWLGNATTGQLLDEIRARVDCAYRTVPRTEAQENLDVVNLVRRIA